MTFVEGHHPAGPENAIDGGKEHVLYLCGRVLEAV